MEFKELSERGHMTVWFWLRDWFIDDWLIYDWLIDWLIDDWLIDWLINNSLIDLLERERLVVVRDTDGTLRTAEWEELDRINQTYYPR